MTVQLKAALVVAVGLVGAGAYADSFTCDNSCRLRDQHQYCASERCVEFQFRSCINCSPGTNTGCFPQSPDPGAGGSCFGVSGGSDFNIATYYDACNPSCECTNYYVVEAVMTGMQLIGTVSIDRYYCR